MDGLPIVGELKLDGVGAVFIADSLMNGEEREKIKEACGVEVEFHDYTGYFSNLGGLLSLTELLSTIHGPLTIELDGKESVFEDGAAALSRLDGKYEVKSIERQAMKIKLERQQPTTTQDALKAAYAAVVMGDQP